MEIELPCWLRSNDSPKTWIYVSSYCFSNRSRLGTRLDIGHSCIEFGITELRCLLNQSAFFQRFSSCFCSCSLMALNLGVTRCDTVDIAPGVSALVFPLPAVHSLPRPISHIIIQHDVYYPSALNWTNILF